MTALRLEGSRAGRLVRPASHVFSRYDSWKQELRLLQDSEQVCPKSH